eukprot:TRINITY_DN2882_c0_g1_i1.p1 TRINITY_DN2882_c0_g1~~TRINITY_DN2882_c0_g1_i1.p1  ORF type:complete len:290 (+),score=48.88 TRINITY_DN2882_c0_g1_i1:730-1599(+)
MHLDDPPNSSSGRRLSSLVTFAITRSYMFNPGSSRPSISEAASDGAQIVNPDVVLTNTSGGFANASVSVHVMTKNDTVLKLLDDVLHDNTDVTKAIDTALGVESPSFKIEGDIQRYRSSEDQKSKHALYDPEAPPTPPSTWDPEVRKASGWVIFVAMTVLACCVGALMLFHRRMRRRGEKYSEDGNDIHEMQVPGASDLPCDDELPEEAIGHEELQVDVAVPQGAERHEEVDNDIDDIDEAEPAHIDGGGDGQSDDGHQVFDIYNDPHHRDVDEHHSVFHHHHILNYND